jgi:hypothetical protein
MEGDLEIDKGVERRVNFRILALAQRKRNAIASQ